MEHKELTTREWYDAMRVSGPQRNKKKYSRKAKHKKKVDEQHS